MQRMIRSPATPGPIGPRLLIRAATVQPRSRATNARAADAAGPERLSMSHTPNTNLIEEIHEAWARANGYRPQAASIKRAGGPAGIKHQASKKKLDKSSHPRYSRSQGRARDGQAIDICGGPLMGPRNSAAEILQQRGRYARHEKSPARGRNGSCRVMVSNPRDKRRKHQAPSYKPQA